MSKFLIETSAVEGVSDSIKSIFNSAREVVNSVNKYNTDNDDNFDFSSAKDAILTNVTSSLIKFKLTNLYLNDVVNTHTELQESVNPKKSSGGSGSRGSSYGGYWGSGGGSGSSGTDPDDPEDTGSISPEVLAQLIASGLFSMETIDKLKTMDDLCMVLSIPKDDEEKEKYIELATSVAKEYGIEIIIDEIDEDRKDVKPCVSLIKNGLILAKTYEISDEDSIKGLFEKVKDDNSTEELETDSEENSDEEQNENQDEGVEEKEDGQLDSGKGEVILTPVAEISLEKIGEQLDQL